MTSIEKSPFVEAATGQSNDQVNTRIDTQINELEDSFQDYDINAMSMRANSRSGDKSWNNSFDKPSQRNNSFNSSHSSRSNYRDNSYSSNRDNQMDKDSTGTTLEISDTNKHRDTIRETNITSIDTTKTKTETGLITEEDQINTNTIGINIKHRSFLNSRTKT